MSAIDSPGELLHALVFLTLSSFVYISFLFFFCLFASRRSLDTVVCDGRALFQLACIMGGLIVYTYISDAQNGLDGYMHIHTYTYIMHCRWDGDLHSLSQSGN